MACFIAPVTEAIVTTIAVKVIEKKEQHCNSSNHETVTSIPFSQKLKWLRNMLWGGSALLFFEHVWHGEVVPWFPFLTAASNDASEMLYEIATTGLAMSAFVTVAWLGMLGVSAFIVKREKKVALPEC